ncbi:unnamed protein product [Camellia sinensis]
MSFSQKSTYSNTSSTMPLHCLLNLYPKQVLAEEITKKIFKLLTSLLNEFKKFSAALIRIEQETKARQERDREAYMQYQYKPKMPIFGGGSLKMVSGAYYIPKSKKLNPLGEDAYFICDEKQTIGVADGIGGWAKKGIDAGVYAQELMANSLLALQNEPWEAVDLNKVLNEAYLNSKPKGSSTACIITLAGHRWSPYTRHMGNILSNHFVRGGDLSEDEKNPEEEINLSANPSS